MTKCVHAQYIFQEVPGYERSEYWCFQKRDTRKYKPIFSYKYHKQLPNNREY